MTITAFPTNLPSRSTPSTFSTLADELLSALTTVVAQANEAIIALNLNSTTDTSGSSVAIGTGAKTFTVTAGKSFQPGMWLVIADTAAPSTNQMYGSVTSYSSTTLIMNITMIWGSGTKTAWAISQSAPSVLAAGAITEILVGSGTGTPTWTTATGTGAPARADAPTFTTTITTPNVYGSSADNGDLGIDGTSSSTKTTSYVRLQPNGGNVSIGGCTSPRGRLEILGSGTPNTSGEAVHEATIVGGTRYFVTGGVGHGNLTIQANDAMAIDKGGSIAFGGRSISGSTSASNWAGIGGYKSNGISGNYGGYLVFGIRTNSNELIESMRLEATGCGLGTAAPGNPLAVNRSADGVIVDFESGDVVQGNVSISGGTTSYNAFVGSHYTQLKDGQKELPVGAVVISTGDIVPCENNIIKTETTQIEVPLLDALEEFEEKVDFEKEEIIDGEIKKIRVQTGEESLGYQLTGDKIKKIMRPVYAKTIIKKNRLKENHRFDSKNGKIFKTITTTKAICCDAANKEYFPFVDITDTPGDKRVYGVWFSKMSDDSRGAAFGADDKSVYLIAQVGLFKIRVTDTNGNIEIGDFLESSTRPMEAQRQATDNKTNATISKALVGVNWDSEPIDPDLGYKWKLIPCIF